MAPTPRPSKREKNVEPSKGCGLEPKWLRSTTLLSLLNPVFIPAAREAQTKQQIYYPPDPGRKRPKTIDVRGEISVRTLPKDAPWEGRGLMKKQK